MNPVILADNRFLDGTPIATDTASGDYNVLYVRDLKEFTFWKAASFGTKYIRVDCGSAKSADALGIKQHNLGTASASVSVESSTTGAWAGEQVVRLSPFTPGNDRAILKPFTSASARYWRVKIVTASVVPQLAICMLGERLTFPYPPVAPFRPISQGVETDTTRGKTGLHLGTVIRYKPITIDATFRDLARATWVESDYLPLWESYLSEMKPFFWGEDLDTYPTKVFFARMSEKAEYAPSFSILSRVDDLTLNMIATAEY